MKIKWLVVIIIGSVLILALGVYFTYQILLTPKPCGDCASPSSTLIPSETETYLLPEKS